VIQKDIKITLNFSRFIVQDLENFFVFVTCRKIDDEPKAIAMRLFVFTRKGNSRPQLVSTSVPQKQSAPPQVFSPTQSEN
jgi:hypothetical protein